jgi:hypothetical protein
MSDCRTFLFVGRTREDNNCSGYSALRFRDMNLKFVVLDLFVRNLKKLADFGFIP